MPISSREKKRLNGEASTLLENLCRDDEWCHPKLAGYWVWAASCWIANGFCPNQRPHLCSAGHGIHAQSKQDWIYEWIRELSVRLRRVRVVCGDWSRVCSGKWQTNEGQAGIFFDPPYSTETGRDANLYSTDSGTVAHDVRRWCIERGSDPKYRIVLAGYRDEHRELLQHGWTMETWKAHGGLAHTGNGRGKENRHREALFFSPHCLFEGLLFD
jgi:hypothetical protein